MLLAPMIIGTTFGLSEAALAVFKRSGAEAQSADAGSLRLLWIGILTVIAVAVWSALTRRVGHSLVLERAWPLAFALFVVGIALRWWSILALGRFFTVDVAIAPDQHVVDTGPYRYLRHPSYTGVLLAFLGYGLALCNLWSLLIMMLPITLMFLHRIRIEESALQRGIGAAYVQYMQRSWRLVPFIY